ncbi:MAG: NlpC/P60 family protein [Gemmatimonadetes bacterium]|nr:MAG: NlpC/P60 family protein [Gemmatimonadota bacterium]
MGRFLNRVYLLLALPLMVIITGCTGNVSSTRGIALPSPPEQQESHRDEINPRLDPQILEQALRDWWGTPYQYGGESYHGVDCSALMVDFYRRWGYRLPRTTAEQIQKGKAVNLRQLWIGDLLFFAMKRRGQVSHVGMYVGEGQFVHASTSQGVTVAPLWNEYYQRRLLMAKRMVW